MRHVLVNHERDDGRRGDSSQVHTQTLVKATPPFIPAINHQQYAFVISLRLFLASVNARNLSISYSVICLIRTRLEPAYDSCRSIRRDVASKLSANSSGITGNRIYRCLVLSEPPTTAKLVGHLNVSKSRRFQFCTVYFSFRMVPRLCDML